MRTDDWATNTSGGGVDQSAVIGHAPESRDWHPGDPCYAPEIDQTARIEAFVSVDAGLWAATTIGARSWLLKHAHVGHDVVIGSDCEIASGAIIGGHCVIGNKVRVGLGAVLRPFVNVGDGARIGCGAVVVKDVEPNTIVYGNPARPHDWPANAGPDYGSDPDPRRAAGWSREFGRSIERINQPRSEFGITEVDGEGYVILGK